MKINYNKIIWEGWTVRGFVEYLTPTFNMIQRGDSWKPPIKDGKELKEWLKDNQPYYKKHIPEVFDHFEQLL